MEPLLAPMTPAPDRTTSHFTDADVASVSPLRIRLAGDAAEIDADSLISAGALAVGDRVRVELAGRRVVVHGRAGGGTSGTLAVGMIIDWPYDAPTPGYAVACDGAAVSRTTYASLFGTIGTQYGAGDGSTTFNVPRTESSASDTDWVYPTPLSGSSDPSRPMGYRRYKGVVYFTGAWATNGSNAAQLFTLPLGFRPAKDTVQQVDGGTNASHSRVVVRAATGLVEIVEGGASPYTSLAMVAPYRAENHTQKFRQIIIATDQGSGVTVVQGQGLFLGQIVGWPGHAGAPIPANCLELNGQTVSASIHSGLAALFPSWVSGSDLVLPDMRGRTLVGYQPGDSLFGTLGATPGAKTHLLTAAESGLRQHRHELRLGTTASVNDANDPAVRANSASSTDASFRTGGSKAVSGTLGGHGYGSADMADAPALSAHNNVQPSYVGRWLIVAADSAGEYSPTVQATLTARVGVLEDLATKGAIPLSVIVGSGTASVAADGTITFTNASSVSLNGIFDGLGSDMYFYYLSVATSTLDQANIVARFRSAGSDLAAVIYGATYAGSLNGAAWVGQAPASTLSAMYFGYARTPANLNAPSIATGTIAKPRSSITGKSLLTTTYAPNYIEGSMGGFANTSTSCDGITFMPSSGAMTGTIKVVKVG